MSNSVSIIPSAHTTDVAKLHAVGFSSGGLTGLILDLASVMNEASGNVTDAQRHLGNFRNTKDRNEFFALIGDWGQLDFNTFMNLFTGVHAVFQALGSHTLDERRHVLLAILNGVRNAETGIAPKQADTVRAFVAEIAAEGDNAIIRELAAEINEAVTRLEGASFDRSRSKLLPAMPLPGTFSASESDHAVALSQQMLAELQLRNRRREAERQNQALEDQRESNDQYRSRARWQQKHDKEEFIALQNRK
ncbi:MAG: DUF4670 domain-containing protein [Puniceicoccales bacterium]|jgi:hypothetical protein|nr:DUF4670 domain-containing protein [Puniceicoccales bacterium]